MSVHPKQGDTATNKQGSAGSEIEWKRFKKEVENPILNSEQRIKLLLQYKRP